MRLNIIFLMLYYQIGNSTCVLTHADPHNLILGTLCLKGQLHALAALLSAREPPLPNVSENEMENNQLTAAAKAWSV